MDSVVAPSQIEGLQALLPLLQEGKYEEALPLIEESLTKQPDAILLKYLKALTQACSAQGAEGSQLIVECAAAEGFAQGFGLPAELHPPLKEAALKHLLFETTVDPTSLEPWDHLDQYAKAFQNPDFIERCAIGRWKTQPENEGAYAVFEDFYKDRPLDEYIKLVEQVLGDNPDSCLPKAVLGAKMQEKGKTALAIRHLKNAHEADPKAWLPHYYLGRVFSAQGRFENAETRFTEAMELKGGPSSEIYAELAECQKATFRFDEAAETLFSSLEQFPTEFTQWETLTELAEAAGLHQRLADAVAKASTENPDSSALGAKSIRLTLEGGDPLAARAQVESSGILADPSKDVELARLAADVLVTLGEPQDAAALLEKALAAAPEHRDLRLTYGRALMSAHRGQDAEVVLKETALQHPNDRELQIAWGRALLATNEAERAQRAFSLASRLDPNDPEAMTEQGLALMAMGKPDEATPMLKEAAKKTEPPLSVTLIGLGQVYEKKGLRDIAKDFYRQALSREVSNRAAAGGWLRLVHQETDELRAQSLDMIGTQSQDFGRVKLFINLLHSSLWEGLSETARLLIQETLPQIRGKVQSNDYQVLLENNLFRRVPELAARLERSGELERAREVWRFGVTSANTDLSQKATAELLRLDTVEAALAAPEAPQAGPAAEAATPAAPVSGDDPLLSLLSTTLPADGEGGEPEAPVATPAQDAGAEALFAAPAAQAAPAAPSGEAPLFAETPDMVAPPAEEASLFATTPEEAIAASQNDSPAEALFAAPAEAVAATPEAVTPEPVAAESPLFAAAPTEGEAEVAEALPTEAPAPPEAVEVPMPEAAPVEPAAQPEAPVTPQPESGQVEVTEAPAEATPVDAPIPAAEEAAAPVVEASPAEVVVPVAEASPAEVAAPQVESSPVEAIPQEAAPVEQPAVTEAPAQPEPAAAVAPSEAEAIEQPATEVAPIAAEAPAAEVAQVPVETEATVAAEAIPATQPTPPAQPEADQLAAELDLTIEPDESEVAAPVTEETQAIQAPVEPVASPVTEGKELLPIMAVDFEPNTRRQLHFLEALSQNQAGVVGPEAIAHLMVTSALGHEPPDPSSQEQNSSETLGHALLRTAQGLGQQQQYRAAARLLKTALLYSPEAAALSNALIDIQIKWAHWLAQTGEFAHAVGLVRDSLRRAPESAELEAELQKIYQAWMTWSDQKGDPAARDLLAVYLQQEQASLQQFRAAWQQHQASRPAVAAAPQAPPAVSPSMPVAAETPAPIPTPEPVAAAPAAEPAPTPEPPAPAPVEAATEPAPTPEAAAVAAEPEPTPEPTPVAAAPTPVVEEPVAQPPAAAAEPVAESVAAEPAPIPEPAPVAAEPAPVAEAPAPTPEPVQTEPTPVEPEPVPETPAPTPEPAAAAPEPAAPPAPPAAEPVAAAPAAAAGSYGSDDEALAALDADPGNDAVCESVFAHFADSMRTLTTALRDRVSANSDQPLYLLLLARGFRRSGSETMAVIQYQKYIKAAPTPEAYEELAQTYEEIGKEDFAKMTRRKAERAFGG